jgi:hypothetical protein
MNIFLYLFFGIFAAAGLACGAWGVSNLLERQHILNEGIQTTGVVEDLSYSSKGSRAPIVVFQDSRGDSIRYRSNYSSSMAPFHIGDVVTLRYDPANPESVILDGEGWSAWFPFLFLFTHGGVGIGGIVWMERKRRLKKWLLESGQEVQAKFVEVRAHRGKSTSYTVICTWTDPFTGIGYDFESDSFRRNPEGQIGSNAVLRALIDPANPKRYWLDTDFLRS